LIRKKFEGRKERSISKKKNDKVFQRSTKNEDGEKREKKKGKARKVGLNAEGMKEKEKLKKKK